MFAVVRYAVQHDGAVRDYEIKKIFQESATYDDCLEYLLSQKPRKNWSVTSGGALYKKMFDETEWMMVISIPDPSPISEPLVKY